MIARTTVVGLAVALSALHARPVQAQSLAAVVLPLPAALRAKATIVRLNSAFQLEVLRRGTNGMVCIDARHNSLFDVRCYRENFIQVVYRAFQLGYDVDGEKVGDEVKAGKLQLSREPTAGY